MSLTVARTVALILTVMGCLLIGLLSHQRAPQQSKNQAAVRGGIVLFMAAVAVSTAALLFDLNPWLRVTPLLVAAAYILWAAALDTRDEWRKQPTTGPLGALRHLLRRRR